MFVGSFTMFNLQIDKYNTPKTKQIIQRNLDELI